MAFLAFYISGITRHPFLIHVGLTLCHLQPVFFRTVSHIAATRIMSPALYQKSRIRCAPLLLRPLLKAVIRRTVRIYLPSSALWGDIRCGDNDRTRISKLNGQPNIPTRHIGTVSIRSGRSRCVGRCGCISWVEVSPLPSLSLCYLTDLRRRLSTIMHIWAELRLGRFIIIGPSSWDFMKATQWKAAPQRRLPSSFGVLIILTNYFAYCIDQ